MGGEIGLYPGEPCDLGAVNVSAYLKMGDRYVSEEWETAIREIEDDSFAYAEYLDLILDVEKAPLKEIEEAIQAKRRIGLGMMGLGDLLVKLGIPYDSHLATLVAREVAGAIRRGAQQYSAVSTPLDTLDGRHNVALVTVAPTGTTAMVMGTTSGIEPLFAPFIYRRIGTEYKKILHPLFIEAMGRHEPGPYLCTWREIRDGAYIPDKWDWDAVTRAISENHGSVQGLTGIPTEVQRVFRCAHDIAPKDHVLMQAAVQYAFDYDLGQRTFVGNSISKTINMPDTSSVKDVLEVFKLGWREGVKGMTVYVDGSRDLQVLSTSMEDDGSTAQSQAQDDTIQELIAASCEIGGTCDV